MSRHPRNIVIRRTPRAATASTESAAEAPNDWIDLGAQMGASVHVNIVHLYEQIAVEQPNTSRKSFYVVMRSRVAGLRPFTSCSFKSRAGATRLRHAVVNLLNEHSPHSTRTKARQAAAKTAADRPPKIHLWAYADAPERYRRSQATAATPSWLAYVPTAERARVYVGTIAQLVNRSADRLDCYPVENGDVYVW